MAELERKKRVEDARKQRELKKLQEEADKLLRQKAKANQTVASRQARQRNQMLPKSPSAPRGIPSITGIQSYLSTPTPVTSSTVDLSSSLSFPSYTPKSNGTTASTMENENFFSLRQTFLSTPQTTPSGDSGSNVLFLCYGSISRGSSNVSITNSASTNEVLTSSLNSQRGNLRTREIAPAMRTTGQTVSFRTPTQTHLYDPMAAPSAILPSSISMTPSRTSDLVFRPSQTPPAKYTPPPSSIPSSRNDPTNFKASHANQAAEIWKGTAPISKPLRTRVSRAGDASLRRSKEKQSVIAKQTVGSIGLEKVDKLSETATPRPQVRRSKRGQKAGVVEEETARIAEMVVVAEEFVAEVPVVLRKTRAGRVAKEKWRAGFNL